MRPRRAFLSLVFILALPFLLSATCVTRVDQKGPTGPWIGEVTNTGPDPLSGVQAKAQVFDDDWKEVFSWISPVCPPDLQPGETAPFEVHAVPSQDVRLPLHLGFEWVQGGPYSDQVPEGLALKVVEEDPARGYAIVEVTNQSSRTYTDIVVCGVARDRDGNAASVGGFDPLREGAVFPSNLAPGEKATVPLFFTSIPDGTIDLFATAQEGSSGSLDLAPTDFHVTEKKVMDYGGSRFLVVLGELDNTTGQDLEAVLLQAHLAGESAFRRFAEVGCNGIIPRGGKGQVYISLPMRPNDSDTVVITGIEATVATELPYQLPVSNLISRRFADSFLVSATVSNPTDDWYNLAAVCWSLRTWDGTLVGEMSDFPGEEMAPGSIFPVSGKVESLVPVGNVPKIEVEAYAWKME
jgi:hypothetical protein